MRGVALVAVVLAAALVGPAGGAMATGDDGPSGAGAATTATGPDVDAGGQSLGRVAGTDPSAVVLDPAAAAVPDPSTAAPDPSTDVPDRSTAAAVPDRSVVGDRAPVDGGSAEAAVTVDQTLALTPDRPGELRVAVEASAPRGAGEVAVSLSNRATVVNASGFDRAGDRYRLADADRDGTLTYRLSVNRTVDGDEFEAVDAGPWALVRTPWPSVTAEGAGVERRTETAGEGVVGPRLTYLGPHRTHERRAAGQRFELVVPEAAEMRSDPDAVLDSLAGAARHLDVGDADHDVLFVAAPTDVDWAYAAQQVGDADAWVRADQALSDPRNAWLHEYVHTRQSFRATRETRWVVEGSATYYAALLSLRQGLVDFETFRQHLRRGAHGDAEEAVLADPATWDGNGAEYAKGALVVGDLDRRIRAASDGRRSFQWVLRRLNDHQGRVGWAGVASLVGAAGDRRARAAADRFATERAAPDPWTAGAHRVAFGWQPPSVSASLADLRASGPAGARDLDPAGDGVVVTTEERLVATVAVANDGGRAATQVVPYRVDLTAVDRTAVRVGPGQTETGDVAHRFDRPGTYYVSVGGEAVRVRVVEPARSVRVTDVTVERAASAPDGTVTVSTRVRNHRDRPAQVSLPVIVDGEVVATRTVAVGPNTVRQVKTRVRIAESGDHRVVVAGEGASVTVRPSGHVVTAVTTGTPAGGALLPSPGVSPPPGAVPLAVLGGLLAGATLVRRRR